MALEAELRCCSDPRFCHDIVAPIGGLLVVDLVAQNDPEQSGKFIGGSGCLPVRDRCILDPANVGDVVDMTDFVDVGIFHENWKFERSDSLTHPLSIVVRKLPLQATPAGAGQ